VTHTDASATAEKQSLEYPNDPVYVLRAGPKNWSVVSEQRYNERGLEDQILEIWENGKLIA